MALNARQPITPSAMVAILFIPVRLLRHVVQLCSNDCAIATAAIVGNVPYGVAAAHSPVAPGVRPFRLREVLQILESVTRVPWEGQFGWLRPVRRFEDTQQIVVALVHRRWRMGHCIAIKDGWVYDPEKPGGCRIAEYDKRHWRVVHTFRPSRQGAAIQSEPQRRWAWIRDRLKLLAYGLLVFCVVWISAILAVWIVTSLR